MIQISVIVCTHNPRRDFLEKTVSSLQSQTLDPMEWEFCIVDNGSTPPVESNYVDWHPHGRIIKEPSLGLTPARIRGIRDTKTPLILFVDDDNVLQEDYVEEAVRLADEFRFLGALGSSQIIPEFEIEPPALTKPYVRKLAVREVPSAIWSNDPRDGCDPWGAGMVVRRDVAEAYENRVACDELRMELDRKGDALNSAGDTEFSWITCELGFGKGIFPSLKMKHLMDKKRLSPEYTERISEGHAYSHTMIKYLHHKEINARIDRFKSGVSDNPVVGLFSNSMKKKMLYKLVWLISKLPLSGRVFFKNRIRLATYQGILRAEEQIKQIAK